MIYLGCPEGKEMAQSLMPIPEVSQPSHVQAPRIAGASLA